MRREGWGGVEGWGWEDGKESGWGGWVRRGEGAWAQITTSTQDEG